MSNITIVCPPTYSNKVAVIKAIRWLTGMGLKEAKDVSEICGKAQTFTLVHGLTEDIINEQYRILRAEGCEVGPPAQKILDELRKLGSQALLQGEDDLANDILQLVLAEKLRRKP